MSPKRRKKVALFMHLACPLPLKSVAMVRLLENKGYDVIDSCAVEYQRGYAAHRFSYPDNEKWLEYWLRLGAQCDCCVFATIPRDDVPMIAPDKRRRVGAMDARIAQKILSARKSLFFISSDAKSIDELVLVPFEKWSSFRVLTDAEDEMVEHARGRMQNDTTVH